MRKSRRSDRNERREKLAISLIFGAVVSIGCGTIPIPSLVMEGTTITIPVPGAYRTGFGRAMSTEMIANYTNAPIAALPTSTPLSAVPGQEDIQRGELVFRLHGSTGNPISYLPVRAFTRVYTDENAIVPRKNGQMVAYVDIPEGVVAANSGSNDFSVAVSVLRRSRITPGYPFTDDITPEVSSQDWVGWGDTSSGDRIPIAIHTPPVTGPAFAGFTGWDLGFNGSYSQGNFEVEMDGFYPHPQWSFVVTDGTTNAPAAWEVEISYPRNKFEVLGAKSHALRRTELIGLAQIDETEADNVDGNGCYDGSEPTGVVKFMAIEPNQDRAKSGSYFLVIEPRPLACTEPAAYVSDFVVDSNSLKVFDEDGVDITSQGWAVVEALWIN